jgi:peptide chain release factor 1
MAGMRMTTQEHVEQLSEHLAEVENQLGSPDVASDQRRMAQLGREHLRLEDTLAIANKLAEAEDRLRQAEEILKSEKDEEMRELAEMDLEEMTPLVEKLTQDFQFKLLPPDPLDDRNLMLEIRAGTGGEEAALFAGSLLRMYSRYAETHGWKMEMLSSTDSSMGGFREVIIAISGKNVYSYLKYESGTHRVQRVPTTETQGRIHTSAATVAVLPEAEETDIEIKTSDLRIDTMCAHGPGGQGVNTTYSAVRILHLPTGMIVTCQDERSQLKNRGKAMKVLRSRLMDLQRAEDEKTRSDLRKGMVGSGDRSGRIRTYNFPQNRVTDHRINLTLYSLDKMIEGDMTEILSALRKAEMDQRLEELSH